MTLCGSLSDPYSRFGHEFLVQDFNGDGANDIIVGAPTSGLRDVTYDGLVYVFLSKKTSRGVTVFSSDADVTLLPPKDSASRSSTFGFGLTTIRYSQHQQLLVYSNISLLLIEYRHKLINHLETNYDNGNFLHSFNYEYNELSYIINY